MNYNPNIDLNKQPTINQSFTENPDDKINQLFEQNPFQNVNQPSSVSSGLDLGLNPEFKSSLQVGPQGGTKIQIKQKLVNRPITPRPKNPPQINPNPSSIKQLATEINYKLKEQLIPDDNTNTESNTNSNQTIDDDDDSPKNTTTDYIQNAIIIICIYVLLSQDFIKNMIHPYLPQFGSITNNIIFGIIFALLFIMIKYVVEYL